MPIIPFSTIRDVERGPLRCDPRLELEGLMWRSFQTAETMTEMEPTNRLLHERGGVIHAYLCRWRNKQEYEVNAVWDDLPLDGYRHLMRTCYLTGGKPSTDQLALLDTELLLSEHLREENDPPDSAFRPGSFVVCLLSPPGAERGEHAVLFISPVSARGAADLIQRLAPYDVLDRG